MTPEEHAAEIERIVNDAVDEFVVFSESHQRTVLGKIQTQISGLSRNSSGQVKPTAKNIKAIKRLKKELDSIIVTPKYIGKVNKLLENITDLRKQMNVYLSTQDPNFNSQKAVFESIVDNARVLTWNTLTQTGLKPNAVASIDNILTQSVTGAMRYSDMLSQLRMFVTGDGDTKGMLIGSGKGKLNIKTTLRDGLNQFGANYQEAVVSGINNPRGNWYLYCCGTVEDSREWCVSRVGKYWHDSEIKEWASGNWQGKNAATNESNILILRGGWSCMHQFILVSEAVVSDEDLARVGLTRRGQREPETQDNTFIPAKSKEEVLDRLRNQGLTQVSMGRTKLDHQNAILEAFEGSQGHGVKSLKVVRKPSTKWGGQYYSNRRHININVAHMDSGSEKLLSWNDQLSDLRSKIQDTKDKYLGNPKYRQGSVISHIRKLNKRIVEIEELQSKGVESKFWSVSSSKENPFEKLKATTYHEIGHDIHYYNFGVKGYNPFFEWSEALSISEYGGSSASEYFAEWYSHLKMNGPEGFPQDILERLKDL